VVGVVVEMVVVRHAEVIGFWRHLNGSESTAHDSSSGARAQWPQDSQREKEEEEKEE
jgi:hypothetical protein